MNDTNQAPSALDERGRTYQISPGTQRLNWILAAGFAVFALGFAGFAGFAGFGVAEAPSIRFTILGFVGAAIFLFALYCARYNQLATFLYPDRVVSRTLFTQASLRRDDIAGYEIIPVRSGAKRLRLTSKAPEHRRVNVYKYSPDAAFEAWFSDFPDIRLTPQVISAKRKSSILTPIFCGCLVVAFMGLVSLQSLQRYNRITALQTRGVEVQGIVTSKSTHRSVHNLDYTYKPKAGAPSSLRKGETDIDDYEYRSISIGDGIPVFYDPENDSSSYASPNGLLARAKPGQDLKGELRILGVVTLLVFAGLIIGCILQDRAARKPLA